MAEKLDDRKFKILLHRKLHQVSKNNNRIALANVAIAFLNVVILVFQLFIKN